MDTAPILEVLFHSQRVRLQFSLQWQALLNQLWVRWPSTRMANPLSARHLVNI